MFEVLILAVALSMDAFAVSVGLGAKKQDSLRKVALMCAIYFGVFQGAMPLIGYLGGAGLLSWIGGFKQSIAFVILCGIGAKMVYEGADSEEKAEFKQLTQKVMCLLAIATSIDAMAAGFTLNLMSVDPFIACLVIGFITAVFSYLGVLVGNKSGTWLESKAEMLGGVVLILIGFKFLLF